MRWELSRQSYSAKHGCAISTVPNTDMEVPNLNGLEFSDEEVLTNRKKE